MVTCAFDWRQSLQARVDDAVQFATARYATQLSAVSDQSRARWASTQRDRESGRCRAERVFIVSGAPNTTQTKFVRVVLTQIVTVPHTKPDAAPFVVTYAMQHQSDRGWLVNAEINGGS